MTKVMVLSDLHAGHAFSLTHPLYNMGVEQMDSDRENRATKMRNELWTWFSSEVASVGDVDVLVVNGDALDGNGYRNGGVEQLTTDRLLQATMAAEIINHIDASEVYLVKGTRSHTGQEEDFEQVVADKVNAKALEIELYLTKDEVTFNFRHKGSSSAQPHAMSPAMARAAVMTELKSIYDEMPRADVVIRSHTHKYFNYDDGLINIVNTPALQILSDYGQRNFDGFTSLGFLVFDVEDGAYTMTAHLTKLKSAKPKVYGAAK